MKITKTEVETKMGREFVSFTFATAEEAKAFKMWIMTEVGFSHWSIFRAKNVVRTDSLGLGLRNNRGSY